MTRSEVAIIGMGITPFGEHFDKSYGDMVIDSASMAFSDAGIRREEVEAAWLGTAFSYTYCEEGSSGSSLSEPLNLSPIPVTRVANYCATGLDALRNAAFAVRAGEYEIVLALGVEKMRDVSPRESVLEQHINGGHPMYAKGRTAPGIFSLIANRYAHDFEDPRASMTAIAIKNHEYGSLNPRAHLRKRLTADDVLGAPMVATPLGLYDCCPTTDGAAAVIVTSIDRARELGRPFVIVRALEIATGPGYFTAESDSRNNFLGFKSTQDAAERAYKRVGIENPATELDVVECHDCFTITEVINYEDLFLVEQGKGWKMALDGTTGLGGSLPVNVSGGLQSCGHPIGASGLRMVIDISEQILGRVQPERQVPEARVGLAHTLGGPGSIAGVAILERSD
jgi:acetyl-CoA C-acetyltransferase